MRRTKPLQSTKSCFMQFLPRVVRRRTRHRGTDKVRQQRKRKGQSVPSSRRGLERRRNRKSGGRERKNAKPSSGYAECARHMASPRDACAQRNAECDRGQRQTASPRDACAQRNAECDRFRSPLRHAPYWTVSLPPNPCHNGQEDKGTCDAQTRLGSA